MDPEFLLILENLKIKHNSKEFISWMKINYSEIRIFYDNFQDMKTSFEDFLMFSYEHRNKSILL